MGIHIVECKITTLTNYLLWLSFIQFWGNTKSLSCWEYSSIANQFAPNIWVMREKLWFQTLLCTSINLFRIFSSTLWSLLLSQVDKWRNEWYEMVDGLTRVSIMLIEVLGDHDSCRYQNGFLTMPLNHKHTEYYSVHEKKMQMKITIMKRN